MPSDETFTTSSLDAAREYVIVQDLLVTGRAEEAVVHYRKALKHDLKQSSSKIEERGWHISAQGSCDCEPTTQLAALGNLNWCVEHRHEAAAAFLDDVPTMRYWADLWYWSAVASEAIGDRQTASSRYSSFLAPRANAHDARTEDVRRRLARLQ